MPGDLAPDFSAPDQNGNHISLSDYRGKKLVLYFYPKDNTPGCTIQAKNLSENISELKNAGYEVLGVSADSQKKHCNFIDKQGIAFPLLADEDKKVIEAFEEERPAASHSQDDEAAQKQIDQIFHRELKPGKLHLLLRGTNFQVKVWEALMRVPAGELISYQSLAKQAGNEKASRAVGSAMASNRIAYLIPCHRVIRSGGDWGNYRWGIERKIAIHGWEATHR